MSERKPFLVILKNGITISMKNREQYIKFIQDEQFKHIDDIARLKEVAVWSPL